MADNKHKDLFNEHDSTWAANSLSTSDSELNQSESIAIIDTVPHVDKEAVTSSAIFQPEPRKARKRSHPLLGISLIVFSLTGLLLLLFIIPMPYVIEEPGPTFDVLGHIDHDDVIKIDGTQTYKTSGELRMVTVSITGGPGSHVSGAKILGALFDPSSTIIPEEKRFPKTVTRKQINEISAVQMTTSQRNAETAALNYLGVDVPAKVSVVGVPDGSPAFGKLEPYDVIKKVSIEGGKSVEVKDMKALLAFLGNTPAGTTVTVDVKRGGEDRSVDIVTKKNEERPSGSLLGIYINSDGELPYQFQISLEDVGGPSAGLIFSLGIIDRLTPENLIGDHVIAGTGTISADGFVGPISGIPQKMVGAKRDGAKYFLVPDQNCDEAVKNAPSDLMLIDVKTLDDAVDSVKKIGKGNTDTLPLCSTQ